MINSFVLEKGPPTSRPVQPFMSSQDLTVHLRGEEKIKIRPALTSSPLNNIYSRITNTIIKIIHNQINIQNNNQNRSVKQ